MSTITVKKLEEQSKDLKNDSVEEIISKYEKQQIDESIFIYLTELSKNLGNKIESIQKIQESNVIYDRKSIKSTNIIKEMDEKEMNIRKKWCNYLGSKFELRNHFEIIKELDGCLSDIINDKIDPVETIKNIRENWATEQI